MVSPLFVVHWCILEFTLLFGGQVEHRLSDMSYNTGQTMQVFISFK